MACIKLGEDDVAEEDDWSENVDVGAKTEEVSDSIGVEVGVEVAACTTVCVDEADGVLDEEGCARSIETEEDTVLEDVEVGVGEGGVDGVDDGWIKGIEIVASAGAVDIGVDESIVWAKEKWTSNKPSAAEINIPPNIPARNEIRFINLLIIKLVTFYLLILFGEYLVTISMIKLLYISFWVFHDLLKALVVT